MIQFNLLPGVKAEYIKAQRLQRAVMIVSGVITTAALVIFILLMVVNAIQKHVLSNLTNEVQQDSTHLQNTPNLSQILTVQNQLESLPALHDQKPVVSRLFGYLSQVTPSQITISDIRLDFTAHTLNLSGEAPNLDVINTFVDTLKFTTFTTADGKTQSAPAFSSVSLSSFGRDSASATYNVIMTFKPDIFSEKSAVTLTVPNQITTRSVVDLPIFKKQAPSTP